MYFVVLFVVVTLRLYPRAAELTGRHKEEIDREGERARNAQLHLERTHAARERAHKQRTRGLEEQVNTLKDQLSKEMHQKQSFLNRTSQKNDEIRGIRQKLSSSLSEVSKNADLDILERESQRLDDTVDLHHSFNGSLASSTQYPRRTKSASPVTRLSPDKYVGMIMTPTTDPGLTATRRPTPLTTEARKGPSPSYVSPIRRSRKPMQS